MLASVPIIRLGIHTVQYLELVTLSPTLEQIKLR